MQEKVDNEVKGIIDTCYKEACLLIRKNHKKLDELAKELLDKETLDKEDFEKIVGKKEVS
jgi:cell division protease FtsH